MKNLNMCHLQYNNQATGEILQVAFYNLSDKLKAELEKASGSKPEPITADNNQPSLLYSFISKPSQRTWCINFVNSHAHQKDVLLNDGFESEVPGCFSYHQ